MTMPRKRLPADQYEALHEALLAAFPGPEQLRHLLRLLGKRYNELAVEGNSLSGNVARVIEMAEAEGWLLPLVSKARDLVPNDPAFQRLSDEIAASGQGIAPEATAGEIAKGSTAAVRPPASSPFFGRNDYPWHRDEAVHLYRTLVQGVPHPAEIDLLYKQSSGGLPPLNLSQAPSHLWKEALEHLARHGDALRRFCERCSTHEIPAIREASLAVLNAAAEAGQEGEAVAAPQPVIGQPPADPAKPAQAALSVEGAMRRLRDLLVDSIPAEEEARRIVRDSGLGATADWWYRDPTAFWDTALRRAHTAWRMERLFAAADEVFGSNPDWRDAKARYLAARDATRRQNPLRPVEPVAAAPVLSLQERRLQALGDALERVVPSIFRDPRISVESLKAANTALCSVAPLIEALSAAAAKETRQPMRHQLQQLDHRLQQHKTAVSRKLAALETVRWESAARQLCDDLAKEAAGLLAAGAQALPHVT
jgi:hypothetical protein